MPKFHFGYCDHGVKKNQHGVKCDTKFCVSKHDGSPKHVHLIDHVAKARSIFVQIPHQLPSLRDEMRRQLHHIERAAIYYPCTSDEFTDYNDALAAMVEQYVNYLSYYKGRSWHTRVLRLQI